MKRTARRLWTVDVLPGMRTMTFYKSRPPIVNAARLIGTLALLAALGILATVGAIAVGIAIVLGSHH